jgi:L-threonylcarbamoyladenylate synthase
MASPTWADPAMADSGGAAPYPTAAPEALAAHLAAGGQALMPTDTLPALAACPAYAVRIWQLKQRPAEKPLILMGADLEQLQPVLGNAWRLEWLELAAVGWPGALTLVLPAQGPWLQQLNPGGSSLGLRIPACGPAQALLRCSGPLATTSANPSGVAAATTAAEAHRFFPELPLLAPLPWPPASGQASTVLAWREPDDGPPGWQVLRAGAWLPSELRC